MLKLFLVTEPCIRINVFLCLYDLHTLSTLLSKTNSKGVLILPPQSFCAVPQPDTDVSVKMMTQQKEKDYMWSYRH